MTTIASRERRTLLVGDDVRRFCALTWTMAVTDFKLRFYGSALGYAWTLVRPFAFFGVVYFVFAVVAGLDANVKNYGAYILLSMVFFNFFAEIVGGSLLAIVGKEGMLRKMRFPRLVIPMSIAVTALLNFALTLVAVIGFLLFTGLEVRWTWIELVPLAGLMLILATGLGMLLGALYVRFRDIAPIWEVVGQMIFYASPILYVATMVPDEYQRLFLINPIASINTQLRHAVVDSGAGGAATVIGGEVRLLIPLAITFGVFALGAWVFSREAPRIAENL